MIIRFVWFAGLLAVSTVSFAFKETPLEVNNNCIPEGKVFLLAKKQWVTTADLVKSIKDDAVVLLGEHHDNVEHHRWQLQMISGLHTLRPNIVLGFEMFSRKMQPVLDRWVSGELSEAEFLKEVKWAEYWNFDAQLYLPMFHYARMNRIPMVALNVERSLIREVSKKGWDSVAEEDIEGVGKAAPASRGYKEMLASVFLRHDVDNNSDEADAEALARVLENPDFNRFVESQQVWDRAMAEAIVSGGNKHEEALVIGVMGSGHMMFHYGVPEQLAALGKPDSTVVIPWDPEYKCDYIKNNFANAVVGLKAMRPADIAENSKPKLGIYLEQADNGVLITKIVKGSVAEESGLNKDDIIIEAAGRTVSEVGQLIEIVKAMQFGTWLPIKVQRDKDIIEIVSKFPAVPVK